jgi:hypothetical protein
VLDVVGEQVECAQYDRVSEDRPWRGREGMFEEGVHRWKISPTVLK